MLDIIFNENYENLFEKKCWNKTLSQSNGNIDPGRKTQQ